MGPMDILSGLRSPLLDVHRALLDSARRKYERQHGPASAGDFLQALIHDPELAWLRPLTTLVAQIDELSAKDGEFRQRYLNALQEDPAVLVAHGKLVQALA